MSGENDGRSSESNDAKFRPRSTMRSFVLYPLFRETQHTIFTETLEENISLQQHKNIS